MTHQWKKGDRFSVEGVFTELADRDGDYRALFDGHDSDGFVTAGEVAHATMIPPAQELKAPPILDTSKPMQMDDGSEVTFVDRTESGKVLVCDSDMHLRLLDTDDLENIPIQKRTMSREMVMISGWHELVYASSCVGSTGKVLARGTVTLTEGDGMEAQS